MYIHTHVYIYICVNINKNMHKYVYMYICVYSIHIHISARTTQLFMFPYWRVYFKKEFYFDQYKYVKCCSKDFTLQDLILHTNILCGTGFIPQRCWVVDFHLNKIGRWKCFVPGLYQLRKGKSAVLALKYCYMIHSVRWIYIHTHIHRYIYIYIYTYIYVYVYVYTYTYT